MLSVSDHPALADGELVVRQVRMRDARELERALLENRSWLQPWEATLPGGVTGEWNVRGAVRSLLDQAAKGVSVPWVMEVDGQIIGQMTMSNIQWGAVLQGTLGYWVAQAVAGRGFTPTAVALASDYAFMQLGLHRLEICIRPENYSSLRVVQKLGFRYEGFRSRYIHIDGDWRDHYCFGLVQDEVPHGVLARWRAGLVDEGLAIRPDGGSIS